MRPAHPIRGSVRRRCCSRCKHYIKKDAPDSYCKRCRHIRRKVRADHETIVRQERWGGQELMTLLRSASRRP